MKTLFLALAVFGLAFTCLAQKVRLGDVIIRDVVVVTNEQDAVAIVAVTAEAALRASGDVAGSNNVTAAIAAIQVPTNVAYATAAGTAVTVTGAQSNRIATAWQNPASAAYWMWTSDGTQITLTNYSGPAEVVIPDMLDGLPVTGFPYLFSGTAISSISGGANIRVIGTQDFGLCHSLSSFDLKSVTNLGAGAFGYCTNLTSVESRSVTKVGIFAFQGCQRLTSLRFDNVEEVGDEALGLCPALTSVYFGQNAPSEGSDVYLNTPNVTNYVTSSTATGWGATWNGRPVVRLHGYFDGVTVGGTNLVDMLAGKVPTNDTRVVNAITNFNDTIHGTRGGLNLHNLADADGAGFYSADHYKAVTSMKGRTNVWNSAVPSTPEGIAAAGGQLAETVVTGAVRTVTSGNRYFFTTATNVILSASLTGGQVVNYAALRNTATNSITAVCESAGWKFTGGSLTNTLPANTMMTFGWSCNPFTGATNFYATAASSN
jgi:hypothetical protein